MNVYGVCKFLLLQTEPEFELYVTPINLDPEKPAMPIGYPSVYSVYLAQKQGPFATLGLAKDTWALNEHVLDDDHFLQQCRDIDREREAMFFDALDKSPHGLCVCVFDGTDRMQHMFWRYHDDTHPARPQEIPPQHRHAIEDLYKRMDDLVGRTMAHCRDRGDLLLVLSDHGFNSFRRGIDLNRWLEETGYLVVDDNRRKQEHLAGVDWSRTRAFAIGLTGIFLNIKEKYAQGIVEPGEEAEPLARGNRRAPGRPGGPGDRNERHSPSVPGAEGLPRALQGPRPGPDRRLRARLPCLVGCRHRPDQPWDFPRQHQGLERRPLRRSSVVPGVLFCNRPIEAEDPRLLDIAPTVLDLFGVPDSRVHGRQAANREPGSRQSVAGSRSPKRFAAESTGHQLR